MSTLRLNDVDQLVDVTVNLEKVRVGLLADFAFKLLPIHASQTVSFFLLHLGRQPILQAVVVNKAN